MATSVSSMHSSASSSHTRRTSTDAAPVPTMRRRMQPSSCAAPPSRSRRARRSVERRRRADFEPSAPSPCVDSRSAEAAAMRACSSRSATSSPKVLRTSVVTRKDDVGAVASTASASCPKPHASNHAPMRREARADNGATRGTTACSLTSRIIDTTGPAWRL